MKHFLLIALMSLGFGSPVFSQDNAGWLQSRSIDPEVVADQIAGTATRSRAGNERFQSPQNISEHEAAASLGEPQALTAPTPTVGGNEADEITPEIQELARGLQYDPLKIFEYVYNYIEFEPYYGSKKGAHLTLLEGSGNDFDQSSLLVALLRASGKTPTYKYGACDFSYGELELWMGMSPTPFSHLTDAEFTAQYPGTSATLTNRKLAQGIEWFFDCGYYIKDPYLSGGEVFFSVPHVWVELSADGQVRRMSPSFKPHDSFNGINLNTATGYSKTQILADAAVNASISSSPDSATSLNYGNISSRLASYSQALRTYLKDNEDETEAELITGTRRIRKATFETWADLDPIYPWTGCPWLSITPWSEIPVAQMSKLQVKCGTYNYNASPPSFTTTAFNKTVNMPGLRGRKLSLSWSGNTATLRLDEGPLGGDPVAASFSVSGGAVDVQLKATHNHYYKDPTTYVDSMFGRNDQTETKSYLKGDSYGYAFVYSFDNPEKLSRVRQEILDGYRRSGLTDADWEVRTETLNIMGLQWYNQTSRMNRIVASRYNIIPMYMHRFGRVAQEASYYIDVGLQASQSLQRNEDDSLVAKFFQFGSMVHSAMEHGVIEQMQGESKNAASTVKMVYLANQGAIPVYRVNASNWASVSSQLTNYGGVETNAGQFSLGVRYKITVKGTTNFTLIGAPNSNVGTLFTATGPGTGTGKATPTGTADLEAAVNDTVEPGVALVPKDGQIAINQWKGSGYAVDRPSSSLMKISGGYFGGYNSQLGNVSYEELVKWIQSNGSYTIDVTSNQNVPYAPNTTPSQQTKDPVDMLSGAFILEKVEMTLGSGVAPRGLSFSTHYNSNSRYDKSPGLGYGWTHNYDISATKRSSVTAALNGTISYQSTPFVAAMLVASDLYGSHTNAKEWTTAALVIHWAVEQMKYNAVGVSIGNRTLEFVLLPDGSYEPPAGTNMALVRQGSGSAEYFTLTEQNGPTYTFGTSGKISSITDVWGQSQTFAYSSGKLTSVTDAYGRAFTFAWSGDKISSVSDSNSRTVGFGYSGDNLASCIDPENKTWSYTYDADRRITETKDPSNRLIAKNTYDSKGRVSEQLTFGDSDKKYLLYYTGYCNTEENPLEGRTSYLYDSRGRSIAVIDALGNLSETYYDGHDRKIYTISPEGDQVDFYHDKFNNTTKIEDELLLDTVVTYDSSNRVKTITDKRGNVTTFNTYNGQHQPLLITAPLGRTTTTTYTSTGEVDTTTDAESNVVDYDYNGLGQLTETKVNGELTGSQTYNSYGDIATSADGLGRVTNYTYNKRRQLTSVTLPPVPGEPAAVTQYTYDNAGLLATTTDANGNVSTRAYSATGNLLTETAPAIPVAGGGSLVNTITRSYDVRDWPSSSTNSLGHTEIITHDAGGRPTESKDPLNRITKTEFDANGRVLKITDPLLRANVTQYTARSEIKTKIDALSKNSVALYDDNGNRTKLTNRRGKAHNFVYDSANRLAESITPTGKKTETSYYANDLVHTIKEPSGDLTTLTYDTRLRIQTRTDPTGTITFGYNDADQLLTVSEGTSSLVRTYDERGRVKTFTTADGDLIQYKYDANGNLTRLTYPGGKEVNYSYNARNQLETITDWRIPAKTTIYRYDQLGRLVETARPNGTSNTIARDASGQILSIREAAGGKLISYLAFKYDAAGQIQNRLRAPLASPGWTHPTFTGTYDDDNRLSAVNGGSVAHDSDGNMTSGPIAPAGGSVSLAYNSRNQLTAAAGMTYTYDSEGRRRTSVGGDETSRDVVDASGNLLMRHNPDSSITYFVYGLGLLYEMDEDDNTKSFHFDQVGSTVIRTDDSGNVIGRAEYSAYGLIALREGDMNTPFLYNGRAGVTTESNGLLHMRARYYSPYLMRFLNADPLGFSGGSNWFAYADGNPISLNDPFGLCAQPQESLEAYVLRTVGPEPSGFLDSVKGLFSGDFHRREQAIDEWNAMNNRTDIFTSIQKGQAVGADIASIVTGPLIGARSEAYNTRQSLYHYTNEPGMNGIVDSQQLNPSLGSVNPKDVRYGNGQYLSDIPPGTKTPAQLSREFLGQPFQGKKYTNYVEIDTSGLGPVEGRPGVWVIPNETPLPLKGRIISSGTNK